MLKILIGPAAAIVTYLLLFYQGLSQPIAGTACVLVWMALWWIMEPVDLGVTSFIPFILFPILGVMDTATVAMQYMEQTIFLFMGGFFMAYAMEKWNLHHRLAYKVLRHTGQRPSKVLLGVMLTTFLVSMWISNTATVMMLLAAVLSIVRHEHLFDRKYHTQIACALLLGLGYTASIGGMATLVGTPTNMIFAGFYDKTFPNADPVSFSRWFLFAFPFSSILAVIAYFIIRKIFIPKAADRPFDMEFIRKEQEKSGKMSKEEKRVLIVFLVTVVLWFTRADIRIGDHELRGWAGYLSFGKWIKDSTVAMAAALALFIIPSSQAKNEALLEWKDVTKLPLRILLLFGSGFALAEGFEQSGLGTLFAGKLILLKDFPTWMIVLGVATLVTILSEFASNVASIQLMLPILLPLSSTMGADPLQLMVPATLAASFGYMLPVATAANTIVYGTGYIPVKSMMKTGLLLNLSGILLLTLLMQWLHF